MIGVKNVGLAQTREDSPESKGRPVLAGVAAWFLGWTWFFAASEHGVDDFSLWFYHILAALFILLTIWFRRSPRQAMMVGIVLHSAEFALTSLGLWFMPRSLNPLDYFILAGKLVITFLLVLHWMKARYIRPESVPARADILDSEL